ncbi:hypothetical protein, partial [Escherichia coli]|uniref:hypothetical protein n=1 Tax=Escherichia coli TaxID=562 RepID=UPI001F5B9C43
MGCDAIFWFYSTHILISPGCSLSVRLHPCRLPLAENPRRSNSMTWNEPASLRGRRSRRYRWIASGGICAAVRPVSNTAAAVSPVLNLSRASPSPALAICTHPGRWRGGAGAPNIRGHLRSSAPGQQHGGSGQPGAEPEPRQPVTRSRDLHPSRTLARWRGSAEHQG